MGNTMCHPKLHLKQKSGRARSDTASSSLSSVSSGSVVSTRDHPYVFGTLCLNSYADVSQALKKSSPMIPRKIQVGGKFLNSMTDFPSQHHKRSVRRVLRRGCMELHLTGANPQAPRRVYNGEVNFVLERLQHEMIQVIHIENLDIQSTTTSATNSGMRKQLSKLTNLNAMVIESSRMGTPLLRDWLQVLLQLPSLQQLTLNLLDLKPDQQQALEETITKLLQSPTAKLQELSLPHYPTTTTEFWQAVETSPTLQSLSLSCSSTSTHAMEDNLKAIQHLLLANPKPLKSLQLRQLPPLPSWHLLIQGLNNNTTLEALHLTLRHHNVAVALLQDLQPTLQTHNYTLQNLQVEREMPLGEINIRLASPTIDFYTQLNRQRNQLLRQREPTPGEWNRVLVEAQTDLSTLYYWLRAQPHLIPNY